MAPQTTKNETREQIILRFLFQNVSGFLALAGVAVSTGMFFQKIETLERLGTTQGNTMYRVEDNVQQIKTDVEVIRERVSNQNIRINNLESGKHAIQSQR